MKLRTLTALFLLTFAASSLNADILTELAKRDRDNPIRLTEYSSNRLYAQNGYLHIAYFQDGSDEPSIVAYQIHEDNIKLIVRIKTWDFAFRTDDYYYAKDRIERLIIDVHDYYLVELAYVNDKLETYCNRIIDINTNGFIFNDAEIGCNINKVPGRYHLTSPRLETGLAEGMKIKVAALINERTSNLSENSGGIEIYDYYYHILIDDQQVRINGYLLDFSNKIDCRAPLLVLKSGNAPQETPPEEARDYFGTWRYSGTGGMGIEDYRRTITITISADEIKYHFKGPTLEYEYTLIDLKWTRITRPDEDYHKYVELASDYYKGASGYLITGTVINKAGNSPWPDTNSITEYVYLEPGNKNRICWYNSAISNHELVRRK